MKHWKAPQHAREEKCVRSSYPLSVYEMLFHSHQQRRNAMPLYMDIHHKVEGLTAEALTHAHEADVQTQDKYCVKTPTDMIVYTH